MIVYHKNHSRVKRWLLFDNLQSLILQSKMQNDASTMRDRTAGIKRFKKPQTKTKTNKKHVKSEFLNIHFGRLSFEVLSGHCRWLRDSGQTKQQFLHSHSYSAMIARGPKLQGFEMIQLDPFTCQILWDLMEKNEGERIVGNMLSLLQHPHGVYHWGMTF